LAKTKETIKKTVPKKPITAEKEEKYKGKLLTPAEIAKIMQFDISMVSKLKKLGVITPYISNSKKEGDLYKPDVFIYIARYYRALSDSRGSRETEEMKKSKERQLTARAKKEELDLAEREGELLDADRIVAAIGSVLNRLRINLLSIPKGIAPQLRNMDNSNEISQKIYERIARIMHDTVNLNWDEILEKEDIGE